MPIPDTPQTRQEQYLNAIATGDASGIPDTPQCRQEQYLDAIARNGGGGGGGSGGGVLIIDYDEGASAYNKTFREVETAFIAGTPVLWHANPLNGVYLLMIQLEVESLTLTFVDGNILMADSEDGYLYLPD